ncbi:uncharacterized protein MONBRDRAFT_33693 [Monosiga brevicollis MX1]|uniref:Prolyl endopeptidase n=1 Tax=Monosiga brevicollis TaxID=81824 RepID=A9V6W7_MONBE|nr:uncharacterized protein MONBRDRAFT_33693 [Monosiga brevicollis MX1]EDQ86688.1 predicted protein [Monosiga brevicollis MX1]|eukprot:XP_001748524.1 hypothetical protein [Monosiga brevicollis MX1]
MAAPVAEKLTYPSARRSDQVDTFHDDVVPDPYNWLHNPDSEETKAFVDAQNAISEPFLKTELRDKFRQRLGELFNFPKHGCPGKDDQGRYFHSFNPGLANQSTIYWREKLEDEPKVLLDPNTWSEDGTVALAGYGVSKDGRYVAYLVSASGSDWRTIKVLDMTTGQDLEDELKFVKFSSLSFTHDSKGFFYNRYNPPKDCTDPGTETEINEHQKLYYHRIGTPQSEDVLCFETPDHPTWHLGAQVTTDGKYILVTPSDGCDPVNRLFVAPVPANIDGLLPNLRKIVDNFDAKYAYIGNRGDEFLFESNLDAPNNKVFKADLSASEVKWETLIAEADSVLEDVDLINEKFLIATYLEDVKSVVKVMDRETGKHLHTLDIPVGSVGSVRGRHDDPELFLSVTTFTSPTTIYRTMLTTADAPLEVFYNTEIANYNSEDIAAKQAGFIAPDRVELNGENPVLLYGYGGFNISLSPYFSASRALFAKHLGGIFAIANLRGGGEYGERWHKAGSLANKQNVFDDFCAAAEYLIKEKYTNPSKLAIMGGSNGGLLVGACANQRPDLFQAVIAQVGVMDMLRFHKFTIGHAWRTDFGDPEKPEEYKWVRAYSPLHHIKRHEKHQYPAILVATADHDDRVVPLHSLKYIAELQATLGADPKQTNPLLARIEVKAGHGAGKPTSKMLDEVADTYGFLGRTMQLTWRD